MAQRVYSILTVARNAYLTFTLHRDGTWSLHTRAGPAARISRAWWSVHLRARDGVKDIRSTHVGIADVQEATVETPLGPAHTITVEHRPDQDGCVLLWRAHFYDAYPYVLLAAGVRVSAEGYRLQRLSPVGIEPPRGHVLMEGFGPQWTFLVDGWHSWSFAGRRYEFQKQPGTRLLRFDGPMMFDMAHLPPRDRGHFLSHTMGMLAGKSAWSMALLLGWVRQWNFVGLVEVKRAVGSDVSLWAWADGDGIPLRPGQDVWSEPLLLQFIPPRETDPLGDFAHAAGVMGRARVPERAPVGWCTWYDFYQKVTPDDVRRNLQMLREARDTLPVEVVQIDDGYQAAVGDWLEQSAAFQGQMEALAHEIREAGFRPGLWLAPFIVSPKSRLARDHPDWLLRDETGKPVNAGFLWNTFTRALDVTHPEVQEYVREVVNTVVHRWGYTYLKLDFLYAAALPGVRYDATVTRPQALRQGLHLIRQTAGDDVFLLGCGCPLGPAVGIVDAMRVGPDIAPHWWPRVYGLSRPWRGKVTYPAAVNAIRNTLVRYAYHRRWWWNDPDCVIARVKDIRLSAQEVQSWLTVVGLSGGMVVLSDDLAALPEERRQWVAALLPVQPEVGRPLDLMEHTVPETIALYLKRPWGEGVTVGLFNWRDEPRTRALQLGVLGLDWQRPYHALDFWSGEYFRITEGYRVFTNIPKHTGHLVGIKPVLDVPHLAGSTFHITQGGEIREWVWEPPELRFRVVLGRRATGTVLIGSAHHRLVQVPSDVEVISLADDVVGLYFAVNGEREIRVLMEA